MKLSLLPASLLTTASLCFQGCSQPPVEQKSVEAVERFNAELAKCTQDIPSSKMTWKECESMARFYSIPKGGGKL